jgi:alpha-glucosidase
VSGTNETAEAAPWWKRGVIYQIYPRSFQDSNGDGVGDLVGITNRLSYLQWLGVDAVWLSPIYPSPMADFGYDVSNYCNVDPIFGDLGQFDSMVAQAHSLGLKVILDFVPNHTSDRHPWFQESRRSRMSDKRDWYIWADAKPDGGPPNNWVSNFGGSAWTFDEATRQYYYHAFLDRQPDLNWRNRAVRQAMYEALRFWLDRGVDGFRVDVMWHLIKDAELRDNPTNPGYVEGRPEIERFLQIRSTDQPEIHEVVAEMRRVIDAYPDRVLIGEIYLPLERLMTYYGKDLSGAQLPFNFQMIFASWTAKTLTTMICDYGAALPKGGWPNWVLGNHDQHRLASRIGPKHARLAAMLLLTLRGTPTIYYGEEIGMTDVAIPNDRAHDPWERREPGLGLGRDPERTPMQWDGDLHAGFTTREPWLPISPRYREQNVSDMKADDASLLVLYRNLIEVRRKYSALSVGDFKFLVDLPGCIAYERFDRSSRIQVFLNLSSKVVALPLENSDRPATILLSTDQKGEAIAAFKGRREKVLLAAEEGIVFLIGRNASS